MKRLFLFWVGFVLVLGATSQALAECGDCFTDTLPYVQVNGQPVIDWGAKEVNVCPGATITYTPGSPLSLYYGLWDSCKDHYGENQKVCGEFYILVSDGNLKNFLYFADGSWHLTTQVEEIKPYQVIGPEGGAPFVWQQHIHEGVMLPKGTYYLAAFVDKVQDGRPTLTPGDYKFCAVTLVVP